MNIKLIYFILFLIVGRQLVSVEKLDIDEMMKEKMDKINNKVGNNTSNTLSEDNESNPALRDNYNESIDSKVEEKIQAALGKQNAVIINSEEQKIEGEVIENKPVVESNNEKAGGLSNKMLIILLILMALYLFKK